MGEAIARFRKYALRARESLDVWRFEADCDDTEKDAGDEGHVWCAWSEAMQDLHFCSHAIAQDRRPAAKYVAELVAIKREWELNYPKKPPAQNLLVPENTKKGMVFTLTKRQRFYFDRRDGRAALRGLADEAIREAIEWGPLAERVEGYSRRLFNATEGMVHLVADAFTPKVTSDASDYVPLLEEWFDAFDGLSPFEGSPADKSSSAAAEKAEQEFPARPVGRPKRNDEALERALVDGWLSLVERCSETSEPAPSKPQYIADRNRDALKDPKLLAALNATHLRLLNNGLRARRRKRQGTRTKRR